MSVITKNQLLAFGMVECDNTSNKAGFLMEKELTKRNEDKECVSIILQVFRNAPVFSLILPNGDMIHLNVKTIEELKAFEKCIGEFESL